MYPDRVSNLQVNRNMKGIELEKKGKIDEAIDLYEQNVKELFDGSHPYTRLAIIYRKRKQFDEEIHILEVAVALYGNFHRKGINCVSDLEKFNQRLNKVRILKAKKAGLKEDV